MEQQKIVYLSNLKPIGENGLRGRLYMDKLHEHVQKDDTGREYVDYIINPNKNGANDYGATHYMKLNTYKKESFSI